MMQNNCIYFVQSCVSKVLEMVNLSILHMFSDDAHSFTFVSLM